MTASLSAANWPAFELVGVLVMSYRLLVKSTSSLSRTICGPSIVFEHILPGLIYSEVRLSFIIPFQLSQSFHSLYIKGIFPSNPALRRHSPA